MKKFVLVSLFVVAAAGLQPAFAGGPGGGPGQFCGHQGMKVCACGKLPGAMWNCCPAAAKCDCRSSLPNCSR
jgi:hypothetical protein